MSRVRAIGGGDQPARIGRRRVLRLGGAAAAGAAGAAVVGVAGADSAAAADGGPMILGRANDSELKDTRLTAHIHKAGFAVTNTGGGPAVGAVGRSIPASATIAEAGHGPALDVQGVATFSRSGVVNIVGVNRIEVDVPGGVRPGSYAFAMPQEAAYVGGTHVVVEAAEPNLYTGKVTIWLNVTPAAGTGMKVAWFVIG